MSPQRKHLHQLAGELDELERACAAVVAQAPTETQLLARNALQRVLRAKLTLDQALAARPREELRRL